MSAQEARGWDPGVNSVAKSLLKIWRILEDVLWNGAGYLNKEAMCVFF